MRFVGEKNPFGLGMSEKQRVKDMHPLTIFFLNYSFYFQCFHVLILDTPNPKVGMPNLSSATKSNISFGQTLAIMLVNFFSHWKVRKN
jgi:hypothetical protein